MSSLSGLSIYGGSSDGEEEEEEEQSSKFERRLPVPKFFGNDSLKKSALREEDEDGKIRNFPHEAGNWATYVHVPVDPSSELVHYLNELVKFLKPLNLKFVEDFHISLTKTVVLKHHWIQSFADSLKTSLSDISRFKIHFFGLKTFCNEQKTRTFLSLKVDEGEENLKEIVSLLDSCLKEYNLEAFYENPSLHLSLLWCPGYKCSEINEFIADLPPKLKAFGFYLDVSRCVCTTGNKNFNFNFH